MNAPTHAEEVNRQISKWKNFQDEYVRLREEYRVAYAKALQSANGKTAADKKSDADVATGEARLARDNAETIAAAEWQRLLALRGRMESSQQPGGKFGDGD